MNATFLVYQNETPHLSLHLARQFLLLGLQVNPKTKVNSHRQPFCNIYYTREPFEVFWEKTCEKYNCSIFKEQLLKPINRL